MAVTVSGIDEVVKALYAKEAKLARKLLPKAAKKSIEVARRDYRGRVPVDSGAMRDSSRIKVRRYKHKADTGKQIIARGGFMKGKMVSVKRVVAEDIGASLVIDQDVLKKKASKGAKSVRVKFAKSAKTGKTRAVLANFYPSQVELGNKRQAGQRPLTKSLYDNADKMRQVYADTLAELVR
jgi:hypothetical protein